jgi:hypothetical protein
MYNVMLHYGSIAIRGSVPYCTRVSNYKPVLFIWSCICAYPSYAEYAAYATTKPTKQVTKYARYTAHCYGVSKGYMYLNTVCI